MNTKIIEAINTDSQLKPYLPTTPRGRALFTIDWFLNGKPVLRNHDNPQLSINNGCRC